MPSLEGQLIGQYQIVAPIGQGGMAAVYKAYHARLNRHVAIKMVHQGIVTDRSFLARFEREAQIVAGLEHPHIVPVYDFFEHEGTPCLVMKFIEGWTLKAMLANGSLSPDEATQLLFPIADALDYAHGQGFLHRDIKPSNILIDTKDTSYLTDFGLAKLAQNGESSISENMLIGTPFYISPEQGTGNQDITPRSDLYSFGVVLYELLVGSLPFGEGTPYAVVHDHIYKPLPLPSSRNPAISRGIEAVLLKALAKNPLDRYGSAMELINALHDAFVVEVGALHESSSRRQLHSNYNSNRSTKIEPQVVTPESGGASATQSLQKTIVEQKPPRRRAGRRYLLIAAALLVLFIVTRPGRTLMYPPAGESPAAETPFARANAVRVPSLDLYSIPDISIVEAERRLAADRSDPLAYLTLARALLEANLTLQADKAIRDGAVFAESNLINYLVSAGNAAADLERASAAFLVYNAVLNEAEDKAIYPAVRAHVGERLYILSSSSRIITPLEVRLIRTEEYRSPVLTTMVARALISNGRLDLAQASLGVVLSMDESLSEAHLVLGELYQLEGDSEHAESEWTRLIEDANAPAWIRDRARQLLDRLNAT
jgi:serine/threonine protein kinase